MSAEKVYNFPKLVYPSKPDLIIRNLLSEDECDFLRKCTEVFEEDTSPIVTLRREKKGLYQVDRQYWTFREYPVWFNKLWKKIRNYYQHDIRRPRHLHIMKYRKPGDGLEWHSEGRISYVSFSINLSDSTEHEGGDLEVKDIPDLKLNKGDGIVYSGKSVHRVTPLISGTKYSFVAWFKDVSRMKEVYKKPFPYDKEKKT